MTAFWFTLSQRARTSLVAGVIVIIASLVLGVWWFTKADYQVLFSDLKPQDAQAMVAELERLKIPYQLSEGGAAILVDRPVVHATRLKLMGRDLPLHGAVGFELFNNTDFGMTEFAQKINYQRALQGEITRTIQSLAEVRDVRVLLALPEQGLFKLAAARPKASITLTLRQGQALRVEQVGGIQRLVAAAVPGMSMQDVTIVDSQGVALTRGVGAEDEVGAGSTRLDLKRDTENYLSRKAAMVLERAFGPGQALASVDVTLNMDHVRTTTEDVIAAPTRQEGVPAGVMVREREVVRDTGAPLDTRPGDGMARTGSSQREIEYAVGRRVEQMVSQPGSIRRLQVIAVVRHPLETQQEEQVRRMVAAAVGASSDRGDVVVVQTIGAVGGTIASVSPPSDAVPARLTAPGASEGSGSTGGLATQNTVIMALGAVVVAVLVMALVIGRARARSANSSLEQTLSEAERDAALRAVQEWLSKSPIGSATPAGASGGAGFGDPQEWRA
ncbi:flagellar basal-body MS-ring/collar protein FliF [Variovorax terrae]|uniref:Flagellar M-ring protein n=1 Tax=Variovorax terrae TaxID=2923278 RepID=A0A9X1W1Q1_9BURK|nr:flagellar basal-body MS-ring/collar protein FliF [Variovorax terrae]MCJ0764543.1 flagellar M-ring protein FliF [Variovorax terrae]